MLYTNAVQGKNDFAKESKILLDRSENNERCCKKFWYSSS